RIVGAPFSRPQSDVFEGHAEGTTMCWPEARPDPLTWTRPSASSKRPRETGTRGWTPPAEPAPTAYPPLANERRALTGTTSALGTLAVVMATWTGAWSRLPVAAGSEGVMSTVT